MKLENFGLRSSANMTASDRESLRGIMTGLDYDQIYVDAWKSTIARCTKGLDRKDLHEALMVQSSELFRDGLGSLLGNYVEGSEQADVLLLVIPISDHYKQFANSFVALMRNKVDISMMWGLLFLVLKIALDSPGALDRINRMVKTIGIKLEYMNETMQGLKHIEQKKNVYVEVSKELVNLWLNIITAFRDSSLFGLKDSAWEAIITQFRTVVSQLEEATERITRILSLPLFRSHTDDFYRLQVLLHEESSGPSRDVEPGMSRMLPSSENTRFFGREAELASIHSHLAPRLDQRALLSTAIHGIGGVGKSQTALMYAHKHASDYDVVLWIHAQASASLEQSFAEAVRFLGFGSANQVTQNRIILLDWLRKTDKTWLLIFDNAEDSSLLLQFWPVADRGSVLITTRRHILGIYPATTSVPINVFTCDEGASFALHLLRVSSPTAEQTEAAKALSERLGGHALALTQASSLMFKKTWSISKYLEMHARYPDKVRDAHSRELIHAGYTEGVTTVFLMSFQHLSTLASTVLGILSLLAPDNTPETIFSVDPTVDLPGHLQFCTDEYEVSEIIEELISLGLVRRDPNTNMLSTHRLIQSEFRYHIRATLQIAFHDACKLLYEAFPKQVHGRTFQPHFERCAMLVRHVYAVRDHVSAAIPSGAALEPSNEFCRLMCNAAYYLVEVGSTQELATTVDATMKGFNSTGLTQEDPLAYAHLCNSAALGREMSGDFSGAKSLLEMARGIRCKVLPAGHEDIWVIMNNLGNLNLSLGNHSKALHFHLLCQETVATGVKGNMIMNLTNLGRCYTDLGRYDDAMNSFNRAKEYTSTAEPAFREYFYCVGNLYMAQGNLAEAEKIYTKGQDRLRAEGESISADMATCLYKLGVVALRGYYASRDQGALDLAVTNFRGAVTMMEYWKVADCEIARASYMLSVVLFLRNNSDPDASVWREKAERVRRDMQRGEAYLADAHGERAYDRMVESWVR